MLLFRIGVFRFVEFRFKMGDNICVKLLSIHQPPSLSSWWSLRPLLTFLEAKRRCSELGQMFSWSVSSKMLRSHQHIFSGKYFEILKHYISKICPIPYTILVFTFEKVWQFCNNVECWSYVTWKSSHSKMYSSFK